MAILYKMNGFLHHVDTFFEHASRPTYYTLISIFYFLYFLTLFQITYVNPSYLEMMNTFIHIFISIVLIIRFNPYRSIKCNENDQLFIFASAILLLISTGVTRTIENHLYHFIDGNFITKV
jgi:hypothetical protein